MTYAELLTKARAMSDEERDANLLSLMTGDARFIAVVAFLESNHKAFSIAGSQQKLARDHGVLAHAQGSVHALNMLQGQLRELLNPTPRRGPAPPPEG